MADFNLIRLILGKLESGNRSGVLNMPVFEVGRIAVKTLGREAGQHCVVVDIIDKNYVLIDGINIRRRRSNVNHLFPTKDKLDIKKGISKEDLKKAVDKAKMSDKMKSKIKLDL